MNSSSNAKSDAQKVSGIVAAAGGKLVGRTRLQKLAFLLEQVGLEEGFRFGYRHYGPFCEDLALAARDATLIGLVKEEEHPASWGGTYSVYTTSEHETNPQRTAFAGVAAEANAVELELAATAAYLSSIGVPDPWAETARRKPDKSVRDMLERAKALYRKLAQVETPTRLPEIA